MARMESLPQTQLNVYGKISKSEKPGRAVAGSCWEEIVAAPNSHARLQDAAVRSPAQIHYRTQRHQVIYFMPGKEMRCQEQCPPKYLVTDCSESSVWSAEPSLALPAWGRAADLLTHGQAHLERVACLHETLWKHIEPETDHTGINGSGQFLSQTEKETP